MKKGKRLLAGLLTAVMLSVAFSSVTFAADCALGGMKPIPFIIDSARKLSKECKLCKESRKIVNVVESIKEKNKFDDVVVVKPESIRRAGAALGKYVVPENNGQYEFNFYSSINNTVREKTQETLESALRRFKRQTSRDRIILEQRKREHYEKPSIRRKKKSEAARKRPFN